VSASIIALLLLCCTGVIGVRLVDQPGAPTGVPGFTRSPDEEPDVLRVLVKETEISQIGVIDFGEDLRWVAGPPSFYIYLTVENITRTKKVDYTSWANRDGGTASLRDDLGNTYHAEAVSARVAKGLWGAKTGLHIRSRAVNPGEQFDDFVVFQRPVKAATSLRLTLPRSNYGGRGSIVIDIPAGGRGS
jgi:hypothetical protein